MSSKVFNIYLIVLSNLFINFVVRAEPSLPAFTLERFDKPIGDTSDPNGRETVVIYADEFDLAKTAVYAQNLPRKRTRDLVLLARTLKFGPETAFYMNGQVASESIEKLRGGDLYLVTDTLVLDGVVNGLAVAPTKIFREGGYNPTDPSRLRFRSGRIFVFANKVILADGYIRARVSAINVNSDPNAFVPKNILSILSRTFSSANSIQRAVTNDSRISWQNLGAAYRGWLSEESPNALSARELNLSLTSAHPLNETDVVGSLSDAIRYIPGEILSPWYLTYLQRSAASANAAIARKDYELALQTIRNAKPFTATAPTSALTSTVFSSAVTSLQTSELTLAKQSLVEQLSFPVDGGSPIIVTAIRDLVAGRISVVPHQVLINSVSDNGKLRLGFMTQEGSNVRVRLRGQLVVDPSVLELVRKKYANPNSEIRIVEDEVIYDTVNLGLGDSLLSGSTRILGGGVIEFDLLIRGTQYTQTLLRLSQTFGTDATVNWRHKELELGSRTARLNVALGRTDQSMFVQNGLLSNPFSHPLYIDYVIDGSKTMTDGFPVKLIPGAVFQINCSAKLCYAPGSAVRRELPSSELNTWFFSVPSTSAVQQYFIENHLDDDISRGGVFRSLVLDVSFIATPGASPQRAGLITMNRRGATNAKRTLSFISPVTGGGKLEISGRAYWGNGQSYYDIPTKIVDSTVTLIDAEWLKTSGK